MSFETLQIRWPGNWPAIVKARGSAEERAQRLDEIITAGGQ